MRIGMYGMPTSGKSYILEKVDFLEVVYGSKFLRYMNPDFDCLNQEGRKEARKRFALAMSEKDNFIMDGHYAFGNEIAFTAEDGDIYDVFVYLYISPEALTERMYNSDRNRKYVKYDISNWQKKEIEGLREYCHNHNKDFYIIDNPPGNEYVNTDLVLRFLRDICQGYSCVQYAKVCADKIINSATSEKINLIDGDKTITVADTSNAVFKYNTHIYDGNFYTGFQAWRQGIEFADYRVPEITMMPSALNEQVISMCEQNSFILTSGHERIWKYIASELGYEYFCGDMMSAETKYFITKFLQIAGKYITAFGDGMNDYYMLRQADEGYLVTKQDGTISRSLEGCSMEGINLVFAGQK